MSEASDVPPGRPRSLFGSYLAVVALLAMCSGILSGLAFLAPSTVRFAVLDSADGPEQGGPLVLAAESPRTLVASLTARGLTQEPGTVLLATRTDPDSPLGMTVTLEAEGLGVALPVRDGGVERPRMMIPARDAEIDYSVVGYRAEVVARWDGGFEVSAGQPMLMEGVFTPVQGGAQWRLETAPTGSSPVPVGSIMWGIAAAALLVVAIWTVLLVRRPGRSESRGRAAVLLGYVLVILPLGVLLRANFDDGWLVAESRMYSAYGWFSTYWEDMAVPNPTGYLWQLVTRELWSALGYQYGLMRLVTGVICWIAAALGVHAALVRAQQPIAARIAGLGALLVVGAGIGMNLRQEAFIAGLAAAALALAAAPRSSSGARGVAAALVAGTAVATHQTGWVAALPAAAVMVHDAWSEHRRWMGPRLLAASLAGAATLSVLVSLDSVASVALPAVDALSSGFLHGKTPLDEMQRVNDLVAMTPNFRSALAVILIAVALSLGWAMSPPDRSRSLLVGASALSLGGLLLTNSKWAAHAAAAAPAVAVILGLSWMALTRTSWLRLGALGAAVFVTGWSLVGDTRLGESYTSGGGGVLPGYRLFTSDATERGIGLALIAATLIVISVIAVAGRLGPVTAAIGCFAILVIPMCTMAATSLLELRRAGDTWTMTASQWQGSRGCGATEEMQVVRSLSGDLIDPTSLREVSVAGATTLDLDLPVDATAIALWTDSSAPMDSTVEILGPGGGGRLTRVPAAGTSRTLWWGDATGGRSVQVRVSIPGDTPTRLTGPVATQVGAWGDSARGTGILGAPFTFLQIPCVEPVPLPLDALTAPAPLVWSGDPPGAWWWLPARIAAASEVFPVSTERGPALLNVSQVRPTALAEGLDSATCRTAWFARDLASCE